MGINDKLGLTAGCWGWGWGTATGSRGLGESGSTGLPWTGKLENLEGAAPELGLDALLGSFLLGTGVGANAGLSGCLVGKIGVFCTASGFGLAGNELKAASVDGLAANDWNVGTLDLGDSDLEGVTLEG